MNTRFALVLVSIYICAEPLISNDGSVVLSGFVSDTSDVGLPSATIRIANTSIGTVSDSRGQFRISLVPRKLMLVFSYVGCFPDSITLNVQRDTVLVVHLVPSEIRFPEVIVNSEDPAYPIIREAIKRKKEWQRYIVSFEAKVYTKDTFGNDTSLGLISEAYSDLYWRRGDSLRELVVARRQSSNIPSEFQLAIVHDFIDFNKDSISQWGYTFITPLAESGFELYDYKLIGSHTIRDNTIFDIEVMPRTSLQPLFKGLISISDSSYALIRVKLCPTKIFRVPFFELDHFEFTEQFSLYDNHFWFPIEYHLASAMKFRYMFIKLPVVLHYNKAVICFEYKTNTAEKDSVKQLPALSFLPSAKMYDSLVWSNVTLYPLTDLEEKSYPAIAKKAETSPFIVKFANLFKEHETTFNAIDCRYNRAEGFFLGGNAMEDVNSSIRLYGKAGYGFSAAHWQFSFRPEITVDSSLSVSAGAEVYNRIATYPVNYAVSEFLNTVSALLNKEDYYNYYLSTGEKVFISYRGLPAFFAMIDYVSEKQSSVANSTNFALSFLRSSNETFRLNPPVQSGLMRSLQLKLMVGENTGEKFFSKPENTYGIDLEYSSPRIGSQFDFVTCYAKMLVEVPTMGSYMLFNPYLRLFTSAGVAKGSLPMQRMFSLESPLSGFALPGALRTVGIAEFTGDTYYTFSLEHNFRNLPFIMLALPSIDVDIILRVSIARMWNTSISPNIPTKSTSGTYSEYTIGLGRIADFFCLELSYALRTRFVFSVTGSL